MHKCIKRKYGNVHLNIDLTQQYLLNTLLTFQEAIVIYFKII